MFHWLLPPISINTATETATKTVIVDNDNNNNNDDNNSNKLGSARILRKVLDISG